MRPYHEQESESRLTQAARDAKSAGDAFVRTEDEAWALARAEAERALLIFNKALHPVNLRLQGPGGIRVPLLAATKLWLFPGLEPDPGGYSFGSITWRDRQWTSTDTDVQKWPSFEAFLLDLAAKPGFAQAVGLARRMIDNAPTTQVRKNRRAWWVRLTLALVVAVGLPWIVALVMNCS